MVAFIKTARTVTRVIVFCAVGLGFSTLKAQSPAPQFRVIAFYTGKDDLAHISFVHEANQWFPKMAAKYHFSYEATRSEEHTSELQSLRHLVCRLLLEKKKKQCLMPALCLCRDRPLCTLACCDFA